MGATLLAPDAALATLAQGGPGGFAVGDRLVVFAVSLLVGGLAIHVGARLVVAAGDYPDAVVAALLGAIAWAVLEPLPVLGTALALVAWVAVLKWRYPVGWLRAAVLGAAAWVVAIVVLAVLALFGIGSLEAIGVPGA